MNRRGRINIVGLFGAIVVIFFGAVIFFSRESLTTVGNRFMTALQWGDVDTLTEMSDPGTSSKDEIRKEWDFAVHSAGRYYNFAYRVDSAVQNDDKSASVRLKVMRNVTNPGSYEENFQLPLVKVGNEWKVDIRGISREMYPGLPR